MGDISAAKACESIANLRESLASVRAKIDKEKTLVSTFEIVRQEVEGRIDLGPEKLLVVTADRIKVVGWAESYVKYVVVKKVLSTGTPVDEHLAGIKIIHEHKVSPELVGKTDAEMKAWRDDFLSPKDGVNQTPEQLDNKKRFWSNALQMPSDSCLLSAVKLIRCESRGSLIRKATSTSDTN